MKKIVLVILGIFSFCNSYAQKMEIDIIRQSIMKLRNLKSVTYDERSVNKNMFSTGDTSIAEGKYAVVASKGVITASSEMENIDKGQIQNIGIFRKDTLFSIDLLDSIYSFTAHPTIENVNTGVFELMADIKELINKRPSIITRKKDTIIDNSNCYNFFFKIYDTTDNHQHNYTYDRLAINKKGLMPVYFKSYGEGNAEKEGHALGRLSIFNENHYSNFRLDLAIPETEFQFNKNKFTLKNDSMLSVGTIAPPLQLKDMANKMADPLVFKNQLKLVVFGATDCGANPLANPVLNRLNKKYAAKDLSILNIYTGEKADKVVKYVKSNDLQFPVYIGTPKIKKAYQVTGTPNFYLVSKDGKIIARYDGYTGELEQQLIKEIDKVIGQQSL